MSKALTSILLILSIIFIHSVKLREEIQTDQPLKESIPVEADKSTIVSESDFVKDLEKTLLAEIVRIRQDSKEQQSSIKDLSKKVVTLNRDLDIDRAYVKNFIDQ